MPPVERTGRFRAKIKDFGISLTSKAKLPQFVATYLVTDLYNDATEEWESWAEYEPHTIIGYHVLVHLNEHGEVVKCFAYDNIVEAVSWDGETYSSLAAMDLKDKSVQILVIEDTYDGNTRFKVTQIVAENADIGLRKLSGKDLTDIDAKYGTVPTTAKKPTAAKPKKKVAPKPPKVKALTPPETPKGESCTQDDAYQACIEANEKLKEKAVPAEVLDDYWTANTTKIAADVNNITGEEWVKIREATLSDIDIPF